jgi:hypothetical protein
VQNKAAIAANATKHEIIQEAAERHRQEEKAGKQLKRVQLQRAERVAPLIMENMGIWYGLIVICKVRRPRVNMQLLALGAF